MNKYIIYCTPGQTKKAIELGAPIELSNCADNVFKSWDGFTYIIPTAEQMIGWLEEQGIYIIILPLIKDFNKKDFSKADTFEYIIAINGSEPYSGEYPIRKEAILAAIDAALEHLINNKK